MDLLHLQRGTFQKLNGEYGVSPKALNSSLFPSQLRGGDIWKISGVATPTSQNPYQINVHIGKYSAACSTNSLAPNLFFFFFFLFPYGDHVQEAYPSRIRGSNCRNETPLPPHDSSYGSGSPPYYFNHAVAFN